MEQLTQILVACVNPDTNTRVAAEAELRKAEEANAPQFYSALIVEVSSQERPSEARQLAALRLKNAFWGKSASADARARQTWLSLPAEVKQRIKDTSLSTVMQGGQDIRARKSAAQVVSALCRIELPLNQWPEAIAQLAHQAKPQSDSTTRNLCFVALGYICEELAGIVQESHDLRIDQSVSNAILMCIVEGEPCSVSILDYLGMNDGDVSIRCDATKAFYHALCLAQSNFENEQERNYIMSVVAANCEFAESVEVQSAALECLVQVCQCYYDCLAGYMDKLGPLTWNIIMKLDERLAPTAIEFWSTLCDEEAYLQELEVETKSSTNQHNATKNIAVQAVPYLVPLLTEALTSKADEDEDDSAAVCMAAGTCLQLVASVTKNHCVQGVLKFVNNNFSHEQWQRREAAIYAFASIMEGPSTQELAPFVKSAMGNIVGALDDRSVAVRDTTAWAIGRMSEHHPNIIHQQLDRLIPVLTKSLMNDHPRVATNVAYALSTIGELQRPSGAATRGSAVTTPLSHYFGDLMEALFLASRRPDCLEKGLRYNVYAAIGSVVKNCGNDCLDKLEVVLTTLAQDLEGSLVPEALRMQMEVTATRMGDRECELQNQICGSMQVVLHRLRPSSVPAQVRDSISKMVVKLASNLFELFMKVFEVYRLTQEHKASSEGTQAVGMAIHEGALLAVNALAMCIGSEFLPFAARYALILEHAINAPSGASSGVALPSGDYASARTELCKLATGCVGDLFRSLEDRISPECSNKLMTALVTKLRDPVTPQHLKPVMITTVGDVALAVRGKYANYLQQVLMVTAQAAMVRLTDGPADDDQWVHFFWDIRESVLDAYTGIIYGLKSDNQHTVLKPHLQGIFDFICEISNDIPSHGDPLATNCPADVLGSTVGLLGDCVSAFGTEVAIALASQSFVDKLVGAAAKCSDASVKEKGKWLKKLMKQTIEDSGGMGAHQQPFQQ